MQASIRTRRPRIGLTLGDPAGIGPEIVRAVFQDEELCASLRLFGLGPARWAPPDVPVRTLDEAALAASEEPLLWIDVGDGADVPPGVATEAGGRAALAALRAGDRLAAAGHLDALVTAPVSKEALHLAGERVEGQTELFFRWDRERGSAATDVPNQMLAIAGALRVMLLTRHLPLRAALDAIETPLVVEHLALLARTLEELGYARPRIALAGLNPHAGENGLLGSEEREVLEPAVREARDRGLDVHGPLSPDTVFGAARDGRWDGVLALYHDQAFIPIKLAAPTSALTVLAGLSYLRVSPAHGTAFDIVGTGRAKPDNLREAVRWAAERARGRAEVRG